jgi:hypothetical protein
VERPSGHERARERKKERKKERRKEGRVKSIDKTENELREG